MCIRDSLHTIYSDGHRTPADVAAGARAAGLDFMISTDHNTSASHGAWGPLAGEDLLIITGEEVTTRNGHYLALGLPPGDWIDWRYRARDTHFGEAAQTIHGWLRQSMGQVHWSCRLTPIAHTSLSAGSSVTTRRTRSCLLYTSDAAD